MNQHWQELEQALRAEVELLGQAIDLGERKRAALTSNDVAALEALLPQEELMATELQAREFQLTGVASTLAAQLQVRGLDEVIAAADCPQPEVFGPLFESMVIRLAGLQQLNNQNRLLIEQALSYIDYSMNIIVGATEDPAYDADGKSRQQDSPRLFDRKL